MAVTNKRIQAAKAEARASVASRVQSSKNAGALNAVIQKSKALGTKNRIKVQNKNKK